MATGDGLRETEVERVKRERKTEPLRYVALAILKRDHGESILLLFFFHLWKLAENSHRSSSHGDTWLTGS